jgi:hypothetical protein
MAQVLTYPENVSKFNKWLRFDARKGRHVGRGVMVNEAGQTDSVVMCAAMYLPTSALKSSMTVNYDTTEFSGMMMEQAAQAATEAANMKLGENGLDSIGNAAEAVLGTAMKLAGSLGAESIGEWLKKYTAKKAVDKFGTQIEAMVGQKVNPRTDIIFSAQDYRKWSFEYILIPRTITEARNIEQIVNMFRFYMLPVYRSADTKLGASGAYMMGYPYEWTITAHGAGSGQDKTGTDSYGTFDYGTDTNDARGNLGNPLNTGDINLKVNKIGRSVLTNLSVDQAGGGKVAFVGEGGQNELFPLVTQMSLEFQEVVLLGRDNTDILGGMPAGGDPRNA